MESKNRTVWIFVIVALVLMCCCVIAVVAAALGVYTLGPVGGGQLGEVRQSSEQSFAVGETPSLSIDNFAGQVTVVAGEPGTIRVQVTKKARGQSRLDSLAVSIVEKEDGLQIETRNSSHLSNVSVDLEITAPADTRLDVQNGAGEVDVTDLTGDLTLHTGAGSVDVSGASGVARLDTGAGSIRYEGNPQGDCRFDTGAGSIEVYLPSDASVKVDLSTGVGDISVDFDVAGQVSRQRVQGVVGAGSQGSIYAHTGVGSIDLRRR
jgi:hypothetical protein